MSEVNYETLRRNLHEALDELLQENDPEGIVSGWLVIIERVHEDGDRTLTFLSANATGDQALPPWTGEGLLRHVAANYDLYEAGCFEEEDPEDDDT